MTEISALNISTTLQSGESETLEFKASFNDEAIESIGALANARGGSILIGVNDFGNVIGITTGKKTIEDIANKIQDFTDPRLQPSITVLNYEQKIIIAIQTTVAGIPVSVRGRYFKRVGKTNQRMSHEEIMQRFMATASKSWDMGIEPEVSLKDLDFDKVNNYIELVKRARRLPIPANTTELNFLRKVGLINEEDLPTRAALLLFSFNPTQYAPSANLKVGRFKSPTMILDDKEFDGTLIEQLEGVMAWFRDRLETKFIISGKPQRDVIWEFPLDAIREAITNAIIHRDYTSGADIQIKLYDNHLDIWNPGVLQIPLTPESLLAEHASILRNRKIAKAFFYAGLIEKWGSGTTRIADELKLHNMPAPIFEVCDSRFHVRIAKSQQETLEIQSTESRQDKILWVLNNNKNGLKTLDIMSNLGEEIPSRTLRYYLNTLKKKGLIDSTGRGGNSLWFSIIEK